jgi:hypothetical protein
VSRSNQRSVGTSPRGTVVAHGPNDAEPALGQPVFVSARDLPVRAGCYAEYIAVPARMAHPLPPGCSLEARAYWAQLRGLRLYMDAAFVLPQLKPVGFAIRTHAPSHRYGFGVVFTS